MFALASDVLAGVRYSSVHENTCTIDAFGPIPVVRVNSVEQLGDLVRQAASASQAVYPLGGRTMLDLGLPPTRAGLAVDLTPLTQIIDYPARDMTITVQAGVRIAHLQRLLLAEGQRLPIDVPRAEQATLGGAIATNTSGPRRLGSGTLRDYIIGITVINDLGEQTKAGGRVVKNVAGYDLCKLHTGALGTLGIISQVTLKVRPLPESQALLTFGCDPDVFEALLERLHESRTRPMSIDVVNSRGADLLRQQTGIALPAQPWVIIVGFEESEHAVNWQIQQLLKELTSAGVRGVEALAGAATAPLWLALTELTNPAAARVCVKANLLPDRLASWCLQADQIARQGSDAWCWHAQAGSGIVRGHSDADLTAAAIAAMLEKLTRMIDDSGNLIVTRCPASWKKELPIWGRARQDVWLMRQVKEQLDPGNRFNPGRFLDGL